MSNCLVCGKENNPEIAGFFCSEECRTTWFGNISKQSNNTMEDEK